jgi:hypothetical protein
MPLDTLRERHRALGALEELPGERTIVGRCATFQGLLQNGALCAESLRRERAKHKALGNDPERAHKAHPELCALVLEAWPA